MFNKVFNEVLAEMLNGMFIEMFSGVFNEVLIDLDGRPNGAVLDRDIQGME